MTDSGEGAVVDGVLAPRPLRGRPMPLPGASTPTTPGARTLAGLRVAVTRSVDRAGALLAALEAAGAEPVLVPLIDFEFSANDALGTSLRRLAAGDYRWLVVSSITTVRALKQWCEGAGTTLAEIIPSSTSVATIGPTSVAVLAAEGVHASLAPVDLQSAAGLVELWPNFNPSGDTANKVLLPQSNVAEPTLVDGLATKGWDPEVITAYRTVDYPARPELRLTATLAPRESPEPKLANRESSEPKVPERGWISEVAQRPKKSYCPRGAFGSGEPRVLTPDAAAGEMRAGAIHAVVLASGSAARRTAETMAPLPQSCMVIAIGEPTRKEAERLGMRVAATAEHPTPEGIVAALAQAHTIFHTLDLQEPS